MPIAMFREEKHKADGTELRATDAVRKIIIVGSLVHRNWQGMFEMSQERPLHKSSRAYVRRSESTVMVLTFGT